MGVETGALYVRRSAGRVATQVEGPSRATAVGVLAILVGLLLVGCVAQEREEAVAAREAYERCVAEHSADHPECEALEQRALSEQRRYEENARRAWGCNPDRGDCPEPR